MTNDLTTTLLTIAKPQPRQFTEADVDTNGTFPRLYVDRTELEYAPLWWHKRGLSQTASGYGGKLTNATKIHFDGKAYRLYTTCYSNNGSTWFTVRGRKIYVS